MTFTHSFFYPFMSACYLPGTEFDAENGHSVKHRSDENADLKS